MGQLQVQLQLLQPPTIPEAAQGHLHRRPLPPRMRAPPSHRWAVPPPPGAGPWYFRAGGVFEAAGGNDTTNGTWGVVPSEWRKDSLHVHVHGATYLLMFLSEKWAFVALRCSDEQVTFGRVQGASVPQGRLVF